MMSPDKEADYRRRIINAFGNDPKTLKKVARLLERMIPEMEQYWDEQDAEYEMGRGPQPPGYMKRRPQ